jgi:5-hydroxyisourate hydrolase-like protein (transthyretin family)
MRLRTPLILVIVLAVVGVVYLGSALGPEPPDATDRARVSQSPASTTPADAPVDDDDQQRLSTVTGRVTREGNPTAATIEIRPGSSDFEAPPPALDTVRTSADGLFEACHLKPGGYTVIARTEDGAWGRGWFEIPVPGVRANVEVKIRSGRLELRGRARWKDGRPFLGFLSCGETLDLSETDGRFTFTCLEPGEMWLGAFVPGRLRVCSRNILLPREEEFEFVVDEGLSPLTGRVLSLPGRTPVCGARVTAEVRADGRYHESRALTDADGRFALDVRQGEIDLGLEADGYQPMERPVPAGTRELELLVIAGTRLSGTVVRVDDGSPVPQVAVTLSHEYPFDGPPRASARTDDAGSFDFPNAPCGAVVLGIEDDDWILAPPLDRWGVDETRPTLAPGVPHVVELRARRAACICGGVIDERGEAIPGALVVAAQGRSSRKVSTDAGGRFAIRGLLPGVETTLSAEFPGLARTEIGPLVPAATESSPVEIRLPDPRWLDVTVLDAATGAPVAEAEVGAVGKLTNGDWLGRWRAATETTDEDGRARVGPLPPGPIGIRVLHDAYVSILEPRPVPEPGADRPAPGETFRLARGLTISGRVLRPDGTLATEGNVYENHRINELQCEIAEGSFVLRGIPPGRCILGAFSYVGGRLLYGATRAVAGDENVTITLVDEPSGDDPGPVCLRLVDPTGRPVLWAKASGPMGILWDSGYVSFSPPGEVRTDETLWEEFAPSWGVRFLVTGALSEKGEPLGCVLHGPVRRDEMPVEVRLPPAQAISGHVRSADDRPAIGVHVTARMTRTRPDDRDWRLLVSDARTDRNGRFRLDGLGPGEYRIRVSRGPGFTPPDPVSARAGATDVELTLIEITSAEITILDWQGRPVPGVDVGSDRVSAVSDARGVAALDGLDPRGGHALVVAPPETRPDLAEARIAGWKPGNETIRLERLWAIAGIVRDEQGRGVAGAKVWLLPRMPHYGKTAMTGSDGTFRIAGIPAGRRLLSVKIGKAKGRDTGVHEIEVHTGQTDLDLAVRRPCELVVRVLGHRDPDARVNVYRQGPEEYLCSVRIPPDGRTRIEDLDPEAVYSLWVGVGLSRGRCCLPEIRGGAGEVAIVLNSGKSITGRLLVPEGCILLPLGIRVFVKGPDSTYSGSVDPDLAFEISGLPDGEWDVRAVGSGLRGSIRAKAGTTADITLERE